MYKKFMKTSGIGNALLGVVFFKNSYCSICFINYNHISILKFYIFVIFLHTQPWKESSDQSQYENELKIYVSCNIEVYS